MSQVIEAQHREADQQPGNPPEAGPSRGQNACGEHEACSRDAGVIPRGSRIHEPDCHAREQRGNRDDGVENAVPRS